MELVKTMFARRKALLLIFILSFYFLYFIFYVSPVSAHLSGQPPYLTINGKYTFLYPVPVSSVDNFNLPQDQAPETYLVNQNLKFEMEVDKLPAPPEVVKKTTFTWDFGDGGKGVGLSQTHIYTKPGSYFQIIYANDGSTPTPQLLSSVLINIVPSANYKLPISVIKVNKLQSKDPLTDVLKFPLTNILQFDASSSSDPSSTIVTYLWDFGDQTSSDKIQIGHNYDASLNQVFPVLRIKDSNGFIADSYVELEKGNEIENNAIVKPAVKELSSPNLSSNITSISIGITVFAVILILAILLAKKLKKRR